MARSSVKIGIIMLAAWILPLLGIFLAATGLTFGILSYSSPGRELARAGIFLNSLGLFMSLLNVSVSVYLYFSGAIDPFSIINRLP